jgi:translocation and assembly module TamB
MSDTPERSEPAKRPRLVWLRTIARAVGIAAVFIAAVALAVPIHLGLSPTRRLAASAVTSLLATTLSGRIAIERIDGISMEGVSGVAATVYDETGTRVLSVYGLRARASLVDILKILWQGSGSGPRKIKLVLPRVRVERAEAVLAANDQGQITLGRAFVPRPRQGPARSSSGRTEVEVWLPDIELGAGEVTGSFDAVKGFAVDLANVRGSVLAGSERTSIDVKRYSLRASGPLPAMLEGTARTQIEMPSSTGEKLSVWSTFDGFLGDLQVGLRGGLDGQTLDLALDLPAARNGTMQALLPSIPLRDDGSLRIEARGQLPKLDVEGSAKIGDSDIAVTGDVTTGPEPSARLLLDVRALDLRSFALSAPATSITGHARVDARLSSERGLEGSADLSAQPFRIGDLDIPALSATVKLGPAGFEGRATSAGNALQSRVDFRLLRSSVGAPVAIEFTWSARTANIASVPWLRAIGSAEAQWQAQGRIADGRLDANASADVSHWSRPGFALESAHLVGSVRGPFAGLSISSQMQGHGLRAADLYWSEVAGAVEGPIGRLSIAAEARGEDEPEIGARMVLERGGRLSGIEVSARRGDLTLVARAGSLEDTGHGIALRDLDLEGAGSPVRGSLVVGSDEWQLQLASAELDLAKLAKLVRPEADVRGLVTFDIDAAFGGRADRAHARFGLRDAGFAGIDGISANGEAQIDGSRFSGGLNATIGSLGAITVTSPGATLAGHPWQAKAWTDATGGIEVRAQTDLAKVASLPAARLGRLGNSAGSVWVRANLTREDFEKHRAHAPSAEAAPPPDVDFLLWSDGLRLELGKPVGPFGSLIQGLDGQLGLHVEGESGQANLTARTVDENGILAALTMLAHVPWSQILERPSTAIATLERVPITASLSLPRRRFADYPAMLGLGSLAGEVEAMTEWTGSFRAPAITTQLRGYGVQPAGGLALPVDVQADITYDGADAVGRVQATREKMPVFDGRLRVKAPMSWVLGEGGGPWNATGSAQLINFPLVGIPELADRDVSGLASGTFSFSDLATDPEANIALSLSNVKIDRALFTRGLISGRLSHGGVLVSGRLDQTDGGMSASASARVRWPKALVPAFDQTAPFDFYVEARELRAAVLRPLLFRNIFAYFDARLNGTFHLHQDRQGDMDTGTADGAIDLRDARFQIPEIGQQFQNGQATLSVDKIGGVKVTDVSADAAAGRFTASGSFTLNGLRFTHAEGTVSVAKNEAIPITLEGLSMGEAWGTLNARASIDTGNTVKLDVDVPAFHIDLPESSSRDLQSLGDNPKIRAGVRGQDGKLVPLFLGAPEEQRAEDALRWHFEFALGNEVLLRRGTGMELTLSGKPVVDITDRAHVSGSVDFRSGKVEVFGKQFEVEHGTARFADDEPGNPDVSVTARWDSPDGTRVYADFVGPLRTGVLTLRSEPQRAQSEILSILLIGSSDSDASTRATGPQQGTEAGTAGAVLAGGAVTTSLNRVLSSVTPLDITTRVASDAQGVTPEVAVQITPHVTAQVSYRTRSPNPGEKPDRVFVTLDWRFRRNWSVVTTFGDQQSSMLDLIWQYRY